MYPASVWRPARIIRHSHALGLVTRGLEQTQIKRRVVTDVHYLNSSPQLRHLFGSLTNRNNSESKHVNGAPITATSIAHNGTVPLITLVELHRAHNFAGTTGRAIGCGV